MSKKKAKKKTAKKSHGFTGSRYAKKKCGGTGSTGAKRK
jgi:hypothetical protein